MSPDGEEEQGALEYTFIRKVGFRDSRGSPVERAGPGEFLVTHIRGTVWARLRLGSTCDVWEH